MSSPIDLGRERALRDVRALLAGRCSVDRATILTEHVASGGIDISDALHLFAATATPLPADMREAAYA